MKPKTALVVSCVFPPEMVTSASTSFDVANRLADEGYIVTVLCPQFNRSVDFGWKYNCSDSIKVIRLPSFKAKTSYVIKILENVSFGLSAFLYLLFHKSFDAAYVNSWPLLSTYLISGRLKRNGTKFVYSVQDLYPETLVIKKLITRDGKLHKLLMGMERKVCLRSERVVTLSDSFKRYIVNEVGVESVKVSIVKNWVSQHLQPPNSLEVSRFLKDIAIADHSLDLVLGYGGNISESTGILGFVEFVRNSNLSLNLLIAGSGNLAGKLGNTIQKENRITFVDRWPKSCTAVFYSVCDVLVLPIPAGQEGGSVPSKLLSYMDTQKPILCVCNTECEITRMLERYSRALVMRWDSLAELTVPMLAELVSLNTKELSDLEEVNKRNEDLLSLVEIIGSIAAEKS
jgi:colanic acid biosynthesis glycosyl transferase WcaI